MTKPGIGVWSIASPQEPAQVLAARLVERHNLNPPVQIRDLVAEFANISLENWPFSGCDAIVDDLLSDRPKVFLRSSQPRRRMRLTLAHEFGHIKLAWHVGVLGCTPNAGQLDSGLSASIAKQVPSVSNKIADQEAEATRFAAYLLIPERFILPLIEAGDMGNLINELNRADVSADATLMRLRMLLQPGFCFTFSGPMGRRTYLSSGTVLPSMTNGFEISRLQDVGADWGTSTLGDREVSWFRLAEFEEFSPAADGRSATELLRSAILACETRDDRRESIFLSINGVVGGSLSRERATSPQQAISILRHKFDVRPDYGTVTAHADFDLYLRKKVEEWGKKRGHL